MRHELRALRIELEADVEAVRGLHAVERQAARIEELLEDLDRQLERVQAAAVITLVGATGAGKSTLLNALVGHSVAIAERHYSNYDARDARVRLPALPPKRSADAGSDAEPVQTGHRTDTVNRTQWQRTPGRRPGRAGS